MSEQSNKPLDETQKIEVEQEPEGIRRVEDGNDLLFWANRLDEDHKLELIRGINHDPEISTFLKNTKINLYLDSLLDFIGVVNNSQNKQIKTKIGQLIKALS